MSTEHIKPINVFPDVDLSDMIMPGKDSWEKKYDLDIHDAHGTPVHLKVTVHFTNSVSDTLEAGEITLIVDSGRNPTASFTSMVEETSELVTVDLYERFVPNEFRGKELGITDWLFRNFTAMCQKVCRHKKKNGVITLSCSQPSVLLSFLDRGYGIDVHSPHKEQAESFIQQWKEHHRDRNKYFSDIRRNTTSSDFIIVHNRSYKDPVIVDKRSDAYKPIDFEVEGGSVYVKDLNTRQYDPSDAADESVVRIRLMKTIAPET